ncbi:probable LRR receptor-like serine/threonine-protein kinase At1g67720 isoform X4 [Panicum virgatum]|uniref:probable LRR receptor-like serine/threonine-protein kinase At1g67720 isoform X4 n=1 Tax=Panicum virgatum TaxID=38727 RepID=UPI0019D580DA|nr:probable LRR receptor-like serine/threonine-protein kinase At1g67720 isoform X4 [Panicum virgatum]
MAAGSSSDPATGMATSLLSAALLLFSAAAAAAQMPGFVSIDCGGSANYTDGLGLLWTGDAEWFPFGETATIAVASEKRTQYSTVRYFPAVSPSSPATSSSTSTKHCYTLPVRTRTRYLVRATFLYGNFDSSNVFPEFDLYLGATRWSTIVIYDDAKVVTREAVVLAAAPALSVCLSNATTGQPFISTLELRQLNGSLYYTDCEADAFLGLAARINFGAPTAEPVRYPDDPYDRIWESDMVRRANYLVDVAPGTVNVSTDRPVFVASGERPPQKVMQTAVVGSLGELTYRLNLNGFPGTGWAFSYLAEIEEFVVPETRKFKLYIPGLPDVSKPTVDIGENAPGKYRLYEPGFFNITLPFVLSFAFRKTNDSSKGPILNAFEIYKYIRVEVGSPDGPVMAGLASRYPLADWAMEGGDPCLPSPWSWVRCNSEAQPRVISIHISGKNLTGNVPPEVGALPCLAEIGLANNMLTGPIPDLSGSSNLSIIHLENNQLTGNVPSYFGSLPKLSELYLQNNKLSGSVPRALLSRSIIFNYSGNMYLGIETQEKTKHVIIIISVLLGASLLLEIAEDAAKGIEYLHTGCTPSIIHRDIKTSNILLDKEMRAKVSDFGLSKLAAEESHASTNVRGTLGYLDPQYYTSQQLTEKSDMYSFGIILLELISGRPPISTISFGEQFRSIGPWAKSYYESGDIEAIIDPSIISGGGYQDVQSIWKMAEAAVRCIDTEPRKRPCMPEVVKEIQDAMALERSSETATVQRGGPFSPAAASVRSGGTMRSHDMVMDNLLLLDDDDSATSFSGSVGKLKYPELR